MQGVESGLSLRELDDVEKKMMLKKIGQWLGSSPLAGFIAGARS